jgi:ATP-dependent RNA helicase RhlB
VAANAAVPAVEGERAPRKRRRRRGGRRIENGEAAQAVKAPVNVAAKPAAATSAKPGLLARIGHGLKKLITRAPSSQH